MRVHSTDLAGAMIIEIEPRADERGYFAHTFCGRSFSEHGLNTKWVQSGLSFTERAYTLRGMHFQRAPHAEIKLVRCARGAIHDVIIDLRQESPTFMQSFSTKLSAGDNRMLYIPQGFAHGFLTLSDQVEVLYSMSAFHEPSSASGVRWNDRSLGVVWPAEPVLISERDRTWPDFDRNKAD